LLKPVSASVMFSVLVLSAASSVWAADVKIGVVNAEKILQEAPQVDNARSRLEKEFAPRDRALAADQKEVKRLEEQLARDGSVMSDSQRMDLERDLRAKRRDLKRAQDEFREDFNLRRSEEFDKVQRQVFEAITQAAKDEKFDLVLGDGVIYASDRIDITETVLERLRRAAR
jgi:outer membrane protein